MDLNWIFNEFLGVLFAPDEFRVQRDLCKDGCITKRNLVALFEKCNINFDLLIKLLDYYEVIIAIFYNFLYTLFFTGNLFVYLFV